MTVNYVLLVSRQGKVRLAKWFSTLPAKQKAKVVKDVTQLVLARRTRMCNFLEYKGELSARLLAGVTFNQPDVFAAWDKDTKVVYRRYASLFFVTGISAGDNELAALEIIHRYVELLDKYFGNVRRPVGASLHGIQADNASETIAKVCELDLYAFQTISIHISLILTALTPNSIFNFQKAYTVWNPTLPLRTRLLRYDVSVIVLAVLFCQILDEIIIAGEVQDSSKKSVLRAIAQSDAVEEQEQSEDTLSRLGSRA
ncbi:hypothetical protein EMMF5_005364 [Cystobasidiomycetes sp. EMM_F5]